MIILQIFFFCKIQRRNLFETLKVSPLAYIEQIGLHSFTPDKCAINAIWEGKEANLRNHISLHKK